MHGNSYRATSVYSSFLLLPRGAGSICGNCGALPSTGVLELLYVTVRVTTSRTLTRRVRPVFFSRSHDFGETAEYGELTECALAGDLTVDGEYGDCGMYRRGVRADCGLVKGEGGGIVTVLAFVGGADIGGSGCCSLSGEEEGAPSLRSQLQQLLSLEDGGEVLSAGAEVGVKFPLDMDDVTEAMEFGRLASKTNLELVPDGMGLTSTGDSVLRKSR